MGDTATGSWGSRELGQFIREKKMRDYQSGLTVKDLKEHLKVVPDDALLVINNGLNVFMVEHFHFLPAGSISSNELAFQIGQEIEY